MPSKYPQLNDREWLASTWAQMNTHEIAKIVGCSQCAVMAAMKRHLIDPPRKSGRAFIPIDELENATWLADQYKTKTSREIAQMLGTNQRKVWGALKNAGIPMKNARRNRVGKYQQRQHPTKKCRPEHRMIMEEHLGRELLTNEHVHHIDGNGLNNDLSNLIVLTKSDHHKLHGGKAMHEHLRSVGYKPYTFTCITCGVEFQGGNRAKRCPDCR